jgi:hypothetical protein
MKLKSVARWLFTHEPLLIAGLVAAVSVYAALRYGTKTGGTTQGETAGLVLTLFATARQFVTSPAARGALTAGVDNLPQLEADVQELQGLFGPAFKRTGGLKGVAGWLNDLVAHHVDTVERTVADGIQVLRSIASPAADPPVVAAVPDIAVPEVAAPADAAAKPDPVAQLAALING